MKYLQAAWRRYWRDLWPDDLAVKKRTCLMFSFLTIVDCVAWPPACASFIGVIAIVLWLLYFHDIGEEEPATAEPRIAWISVTKVSDCITIFGIGTRFEDQQWGRVFYIFFGIYAVVFGRHLMAPGEKTFEF